MSRSVIKMLPGLLLAAAAAAFAVFPGEAKGWEPVKTEQQHVKAVLTESDFELSSTNGAIFIKADRHMQVKVFTILGRLISNETLPPGHHRLQVPAHGVYIVQTGETTAKVAV